MSAKTVSHTPKRLKFGTKVTVDGQPGTIVGYDPEWGYRVTWYPGGWWMGTRNAFLDPHEFTVVKS